MASCGPTKTADLTLLRRPRRCTRRHAPRTCVVKHSGVGMLGMALRRSQGVSAESEVPGLSSRVRRAASSLQMQSEESVLASFGSTETAISDKRAVPWALGEREALELLDERQVLGGCRAERAREGQRVRRRCLRRLRRLRRRDGVGL